MRKLVIFAAAAVLGGVLLAAKSHAPKIAAEKYANM